MESDSNYREKSMPQSQRIERLEEAVARFSVRRFYETLRWGFIVLLGGLGIGAICFGVSFIVKHSYEGSVAEMQAREEIEAAKHERDQENAERIPEEEQARVRARGMCSSACEAAGLGMERSWEVKEDNHWRVAQCSCAGPDGHRVLWNDLRSRETVLRSQCEDACTSADMGLSRAILRREEGELRIVACACVSPRSHRALWDDRPESHQLCTLDGDNALRCNLADQPSQVVLTRE